MGCRELQPMQEWLKGEGQECRPCRIATGVGKYRKALEDAGQDSLLQEVREAIMTDGDTINSIAAAMDSVKAKVPIDLKLSLESIDCEIQNKEECGACDA